LNSLLKINPTIFPEVLPQLSAGLLALLKSNITDIHDQGQWRTIFALLTPCVENPDAVQNCLKSTLFVVSNTQKFAFRDIPFLDLVDILLKFVATSAKQTSSSSRFQSPQPSSPSPPSLPIAQSGNGVDLDEFSELFGPRVDLFTGSGRALKSLDVLYHLHTQVLSLTTASVTKGGETSPVENLWSGYWLPILSGLGSNCCHPIPEVRQSSLTLLSKGLLLADLNLLTPKELYLCFDKV